MTQRAAVAVVVLALTSAVLGQSAEARLLRAESRTLIDENNNDKNTNSSGTPEEQRFEDAWIDGGVLIHMVGRDYAEASLTNQSLALDADCGPACASWLFAEQGIPLVLPESLESRIGIVVARKSPFTERYGQAMAPHRLNPASRQFCSEPQFPDVSTVTMADIPVNNTPDGFAEFGCAADDFECQFIAAGGGVSRFAWDVVDNMEELACPADELDSGDCALCMQPFTCAGFFANESSYVADFIEPAYELFNNGSITALERESAIAVSQCMLEAAAPEDWNVLSESYDAYLEFVRDAQDAMRANEVTTYVPMDAQVRESAADEQEEAVVAVVYHDTSPNDNLQFAFARSMVGAYNRRNPEAPIALFKCTGRNEWANFTASDEPDALFGPNGCERSL